MTSTDPCELKKLTAPVDDNPEVPAFGVAGSRATQFRLDAVGCGASEGHTVKKLLEDGLTTVTFISTPTASIGMLQSPFGPVTCCVRTPPWTIPLASIRVSKRRQATIGVSTDPVVVLAADAVNKPPEPNNTTVAPTTASLWLAIDQAMTHASSRPKKPQNDDLVAKVRLNGSRR